MSPEAKEILATFLSWAIMIALIIIIIGGIMYVFETSFSVQTLFTTSGFNEWLISLFQVSAGLGILVIGLMVTGTFLLSTIFVLLLKNGQRILLRIITEF